MSSSINTHVFFCNETDCNNMTAYYDSKCPMCACPGCGDMGATVLGSDYCHTCLSVRDHPCNTGFNDYEHEDTIRCGECDDGSVCAPDIESNCTCDGTGLMCDFCSEEYKEPCRGCGVLSHLWTDETYCHTCYVERYGDAFPKKVRVSDEHKAELLANLPTEDDGWSFTAAHPPLPPSPLIEEAFTLDELRTIIAEIEVRLRGGLTKGQRDDWVWLLQNRRADLAEAEKEMCVS